MSEPAPTITSFALGDWMTNCHVVTVGGSAADAKGRRPCWIVDCGQRPRELLDFIESERLAPQAILLTHCHVDHIAGIDEARARLGEIPIVCHALERDWNEQPILNLSAYSGAAPVAVAPPSELLRGGETLELAGTHWSVLHVPGHSPGSVAFVHAPSRQAITGDTLFAGSIGRSDFPTSDPAALKRSLQDVILRLPDDTTIHPGHGPRTTIGHERRTNPFLLQPALW